MTDPMSRLSPDAAKHAHRLAEASLHDPYPTLEDAFIERVEAFTREGLTEARDVVDVCRDYLNLPLMPDGKDLDGREPLNAQGSRTIDNAIADRAAFRAPFALWYLDRATSRASIDVSAILRSTYMNCLGLSHIAAPDEHAMTRGYVSTFEEIAAFACELFGKKLFYDVLHASRQVLRVLELVKEPVNTPAFARYAFSPKIEYSAESSLRNNLEGLRVLANRLDVAEDRCAALDLKGRLHRARVALYAIAKTLVTACIGLVLRALNTSREGDDARRRPVSTAELLHREKAYVSYYNIDMSAFAASAEVLLDTACAVGMSLPPGLVLPEYLEREALVRAGLRAAARSRASHEAKIAFKTALLVSYATEDFARRALYDPESTTPDMARKIAHDPRAYIVNVVPRP